MVGDLDGLQLGRGVCGRVWECAVGIEQDEVTGRPEGAAQRSGLIANSAHVAGSQETAGRRARLLWWSPAG